MLLAILLAVAVTGCGRLGHSGGAVGTITGITIDVSATIVLTPGSEMSLDLSFTGTGAIPSDVTIESADDTIATAGEGATIRGVAPGETTATITSVADETISITISVIVTDPLPDASAFSMTDVLGSAGLLIGDQVVSPTTTVADDRFTISGSDLVLSVGALVPDGELLPIFRDEGFVSGTTQGALELTGSSYEPGTVIAVFIGTPEIPVGTGIVNDDGTYRVTLDLPSALGDGEASLILIGEPIDTASASTAFFGGRLRAIFRMPFRIDNWLTPRVRGIEVRPASIAITPEESSTIIARVRATGWASRTVTWTSSDRSVATVDATGKVTGVTAGTATITVASTTDSSKTAEVTVTVNLPTITEISVTPSIPIELNLTGDDTTVQLTANVTTLGGASDAVTWRSSDETVATVDGDGLVTAVAGGTATITATSTYDTSKTATTSVTVVAPPSDSPTTTSPSFAPTPRSSTPAWSTGSSTPNEPSPMWTASAVSRHSLATTTLIPAGTSFPQHIRQESRTCSNCSSPRTHSTKTFRLGTRAASPT